jgi:hypothetical protein
MPLSGEPGQRRLQPPQAQFGVIRREDLLRLYLWLRDRKPHMALWWWQASRR